MDYSKDILDILLKAPEGLSIRKIVRHVYNAHNNLFETVDIEDVKRFVTQYLNSRSKTSSSPIERTGERGVYRLNEKSKESMELMLQFKEQNDEQVLEETVKYDADTADLFAGMY